MNKINNKKGFTLVELLVVISIISILTILSLASFKSVQIKARDAQIKSDLDNLKKALMLYFSDRGSFPPSNNVVFGDKSTGLIDPTNASTIYMREIPIDPTNRGIYYYAYNVSVDLKKFNLYANLENKKDTQCSGSYIFGGTTYCYGITSPNTVVNVDLP